MVKCFGAVLKLAIMYVNVFPVDFEKFSNKKSPLNLGVKSQFRRQKITLVTHMDCTSCNATSKNCSPTDVT